tara:strand:+ start:1757 stop:2038 length:282 start_codon:yes stop_codon:yes gene_type:complete
MEGNEISSLLSILRLSGTDTNYIILKIIKLKQRLNSFDFKNVIDGDKPIKIGETEYRFVSKYNSWSLRSQIEYELNIRKRVELSGLYQYIKSL